MTLHHVVDESQTTSLSSQRSVTNACKVRIAVETVALEHSHHSLIFHLAVFHDGFENNLPVSVDILQTFPTNLLQEFGHRENSPGIKPAGYMVAYNMVLQGLSRNREYNILQFLQIIDRAN